MSYILEALKKAQAERQLGNSPTLHAPTLQSADRSTTGGRFKKPLVLVIIAMAVVIAALGAMVLRSSRAPVEAPAEQATAGVPAPAAQATAQPAAQLAAQPALAAPADATRTPALQTASVPPADVARNQNQAAPAAVPVPMALPAPVAALPPPVATITPSARSNAASQMPQLAQTSPSGAPVSGSPANSADQASRTAPSPQADQAASPAASGLARAGAPSKSAFEEPVQNLRDLPEPIQRSIPQVAVGGYIYSRNAADRLLLIDKVLRREGEEVAPGLLLEKLNPKEAVFNFKGYRYRVPY
jgi:general secretion pathway protein B